MSLQRFEPVMRIVSLLLVIGVVLAGCTEGTGTTDAEAGPCGDEPTDGERPLGPAGSSETEMLSITQPEDLSGRRILDLTDVRDGATCQTLLTLLGEPMPYSSYHDGALSFVEALNEDWEAAHDDGPRRTGPIAIAHHDQRWLVGSGVVV